MSALDYLYEVLLEIRESENCDEKIYEVIHGSSLNEKHHCNDFTIYSINDNCAKVLEEECIKMFGTKSLDDEHDWNVVSMNSLNTHDANDMLSHKLGDAMFGEDDIFLSPKF